MRILPPHICKTSPKPTKKGLRGFIRVVKLKHEPKISQINIRGNEVLANSLHFSNHVQELFLLTRVDESAQSEGIHAQICISQVTTSLLAIHRIYTTMSAPSFLLRPLISTVIMHLYTCFLYASTLEADDHKKTRAKGN